MIGKVFKFFFKFAFWSFVLGAVTFWAIMGYIRNQSKKDNETHEEEKCYVVYENPYDYGCDTGCKSHEPQYSYDYENDMTYMISCYRQVNAAPMGSWNICPLCGKGYYKDYASTVCCSRYCEDRYWDLVNAWTRAQRGKRTIESYGKNFR